MVFGSANRHAKCKTPNAVTALGVFGEHVARAIPLYLPLKRNLHGSAPRGAVCACGDHDRSTRVRRNQPIEVDGGNGVIG